ncbi:MAG: hypothetical protein NVSMB32_12890 [Actinomycetota bacterium]
MICLGARGEYAFEGPYTLGAWTPPAEPGIFAIAYRENTVAERFAVIYLGQEDNLARAGFPFQHAQAPCWLTRAGVRTGSKWKLSVAYLTLAGGGTPAIRRGIVQALIDVYQPVCNELEDLNH